jgi:hypothetical protein
MDCTQLPISVAFVLGLMLVGAWLERINGKQGFIDELFTPLPMGLGGVAWQLGIALVS